ncbi:MAG: 30S ribosomal protein S6 [Dehalococcoidia bacterium]
MNEYEMMTIIHPRLNADDTTAAITAVEEQIAANGGELLSTDVWGRRRLAYPINGVNEGTYVLMTFNLPPTATATLERGLRISESVLRHLLIRGIIPFEAGRDERDDRDDRRDREDRDDRDDRRDREDRDDRDDERPGRSEVDAESSEDADDESAD